MPIRNPRRALPYVLLCLLPLLLSPASARAQGRKDLIKVPIADVPAGDKQALVVGVAHYRRARSLSLSVRDAKAFAAFLQPSFQSEGC